MVREIFSEFFDVRRPAIHGDWSESLTHLRVSLPVIQVRVHLVGLPLILTAAAVSSPLFPWTPFAIVAYGLYEHYRAEQAIYQRVISKIRQQDTGMPRDAGEFIANHPGIVDLLVKTPQLNLQTRMQESAFLESYVASIKKLTRIPSEAQLRAFEKLVPLQMPPHLQKALFLKALELPDCAKILLKHAQFSAHLFNEEEQCDIWQHIRNEKLVSLLIEKGFNINAAKEGKSALITALEDQDASRISLLLKFGATLPADETPLQSIFGGGRDPAQISFAQLKEENPRIAALAAEVSDVFIPRQQIDVVEENPPFFPFLSPLVFVRDSGEFCWVRDGEIWVRTMMVALPAFWCLVMTFATYGVVVGSVSALTVAALCVAHHRYQRSLAKNRLDQLVSQIFLQTFPPEPIFAYLLDNLEVIDRLLKEGHHAKVVEGVDRQGNTLWGLLVKEWKQLSSSRKGLVDKIFNERLIKEQKEKYFLLALAEQNRDCVKYLLETRKVTLEEISQDKLKAVVGSMWIFQSNQEKHEQLMTLLQTYGYAV